MLRGLVVTGCIRRQVTYYRLSELTAAIHITTSFGRPTEAQKRLFDRIYTSEAVIIDDLDKLPPGEAHAYALYNGLDVLWNRKALVIATGNLVPERLRVLLERRCPDELANSIISRLAGMCETWDMTPDVAVDHRKKK
jgi:DNA replication protein DnaC